MRALVCYRDIEKTPRYFQYAGMVLGALGADCVLLEISNGPTESRIRTGAVDGVFDLLPGPIVEHKRVQAGFLAAVIQETRRNAYDLVVIYSQDQPMIEELLLGTVADRVLKATKTSVLVVDHPGEKIERMIVSTGGHALSEPTVNTGMTIAEQLQARVFLLHVMPALPSMYSGLERLEEKLEEVLNTDTPLARHLKAHAAEMERRGISAQIELRRGLPSEEIVLATYRDEADLLVVGYAEHTRFYRVFRDNLALDIVDRAACPVLVINIKTPPAV